MDKRQLIEQICKYNTTVETGFLDQFTPQELAEYLDHLQAAQTKQVRIVGWKKPRKAA
jgi:hypothetical protein